LNTLEHGIQQLGPLALVGLFLASSFLLVWRLEVLSKGGIEGTVLGTLVMPYCSGIGNLIFVFVIAASPIAGTEVMTNCLVNNVTNLTLLIGLPAILWEMNLLPRPTAKAKKKKKGDVEQHVNRLSLLLTLTAVLFFTGAVWALGRDGKLDLSDGLVLIGLFLFWQCFHVFEVLKANARQNRSFGWGLLLDLFLLLLGAVGTYLSTKGLVDWLSRIPTGFLSAKHLGWLSGWLMVVPNAILAFYYARQGKPEVVYTSQVGDAHICIPLCVGLSATLKAIPLPPFFHTGVLILFGAALLHFLFVAALGRLPRFMGWILVAGYGLFLHQGLMN